jgi:hypothetical protein
MPCGMPEAAKTLWSQPPRLSEEGALLLTTGREATNGAVMSVPKVAPLPALIFILFKTLAMMYVKFHNYSPTWLTGVFHPVLGQKTRLPEPLSVRRPTRRMPVPQLCTSQVMQV